MVINCASSLEINWAQCFDTIMFLQLAVKWNLLKLMCKCETAKVPFGHLFKSCKRCKNINYTLILKNDLYLFVYQESWRSPLSTFRNLERENCQTLTSWKHLSRFAIDIFNIQYHVLSMSILRRTSEKMLSQTSHNLYAYLHDVLCFR